MSQKIIHGAPEGQDAFVLKHRADDAQRHGAVACHVAMDDVRAQTLQDLLAFFAPDVDVIYFPAWDCLPYDRVSPNTQIIGQRMKALGQLKSRMDSDIKKSCVVITTVNAVLRKVMKPDALNTMGGLNIATGGELNESTLKEFLVANGYNI